MEESFRRAIRKMTGKSLVRLAGRPDRTDVMGRLAQELHATWSVVLHEHLNASHQKDGFAGETDMVSHSQSLYAASQEEFPALREEFQQKMADFRHKWQQRYQLEAITPLLLQGNWLAQSDQGWFFTLKGTSQEIKNFYFETLHLMVGDAEKLVVMILSRVMHLQEKLANQWIRETAIGPASKILPSLEAGLRDQEAEVFHELRESLARLAFQRFSQSFKSRSSKVSYYPSSQALVRTIGRNWNPLGIWETGFLGFLQDFCDYTEGLLMLIADWYYMKWSLYLRGFSTGQLHLFSTHHQQGGAGAV